MHSQSKLQTNTRGKGEEHMSRGSMYLSMCVMRWCPPVRLLWLMLHPVRWLLRRRLVLVLALLNRQRQPRLSMSLVGMMKLKFQHGPGSEARPTVTACASSCCVCRVNVETLTWTSESGCGESRTHCVRVRCSAVGVAYGVCVSDHVGDVCEARIDVCN